MSQLATLRHYTARYIGTLHNHQIDDLGLASSVPPPLLPNPHTPPHRPNSSSGPVASSCQSY